MPSYVVVMTIREQVGFGKEGRNALNDQSLAIRLIEKESDDGDDDGGSGKVDEHADG